jgi:hypothetical protein
MDPRMTAGIDLLRRTGAKQVQLRYSDDEEPTVWMAVVEWRVDPSRGVPVAEGEVESPQVGYDAAAAVGSPVLAVLRLCERVISGPSRCVHCQCPARFDATLEDHVGDEEFCWYQWDPELATFRRGCEGDFKAPGRNEPCWCGSGDKFKRCHGA